LREDLGKVEYIIINLNLILAPSIISTMINMPLKMGEPDFPLWGNGDG